MDLRPYVDNLRRQLAAGAEAGGADAVALAERLILPLDAAVRLTLLEVLSAAGDEITCDLAPGSVEVRLRGGDPEFVVTPPSSSASAVPALPVDGDEGGMSRINLRMPEQLKSRIDHAAAAEGVSINTWLAQAAAAALEHSGSEARGPRPAPRRGQRYSGWAR